MLESSFDAKVIENEIDYRFKILYTLGIIFVVAGHGGNGGFSIFYEFLPPYMFHLQLFAFCAGYFYKNRVESTPIQYIYKKIKHLIVPLYLWNFIYAIVVSILHYKAFTFGVVNLKTLFLEPLISGHQFVFNLGGWFVIPLFLNQIAFMVLHKYICKTNNGRNEVLCWSVCLLLGLIGIELGIHNYNTGYFLTLTRFLVLIPFYGLGILYKTVLERYDTIDSIKYFSVIVALTLGIIFHYGHPLTFGLAWCRDFNSGLLMPIIAPIIGIAFWLRISKILEPSIGKSKVINIIANNTFAIMIHHLFAMFIIKTIFGIMAQHGVLTVPFDWAGYKTNIWYYYLPRGKGQFYIIYLIAGLSMPLVVQQIENRAVEKIKSFKSYSNS